MQTRTSGWNFIFIHKCVESTEQTCKYKLENIRYSGLSTSQNWTDKNKILMGNILRKRWNILFLKRLWYKTEILIL